MSAYPEPVANAAPGLLPSGTVTFAFTDIEGSTRRWERDPDAMQRALRQHDVIVREEIERHGGYVFKTIGDAFCAAFRGPQHAVMALHAAQRMLAAEDFTAVGGLRVRAAIHTGTADERDGDYFGPTVNRVARLLAIGHGGQILVSGSSAELLFEAQSRESLRELGEHRLKDLARPERVYQLLAPDLDDEFPPLNSLSTLPNNLPAATTSFVGRETELVEIAASLAKQRLVTLIGSGGIGKTRTSLQVAANVLDTFRDGVWFVELASLADGALIPPAIAAAIGVVLSPTGDALESLAGALDSKNALLIFDNCEHLVEPTGRVVATLLRDCKKLKVLASSRQGLGIAGETTYRMPSLRVPGDAGETTVAAIDATRYPALALFVDRARAAHRSFVLDDANVHAVADVCRRLDGIPLAIELAAVRVKILSPRQLRDRLDERFRMLTGGSRDLLPRQQTLRALIDWSYDLLDERERMVFRRLSIFVDGFMVEAVGPVVADADIDEFDAFELLASLVDKSLVLAEPVGDAMRYRMLESTSAYARERLIEAGERERIAERHVHYVRDRFIAAAEAWNVSGRSFDVSGALATELGNVRAALDAALAGLDRVAGAETLAAIDHVWNDIGLEREGRMRTEAFLERLGDDDAHVVARLSVVLARSAGSFRQGSQAVELARLAVERARSAGDAAMLNEALIVYSWNAAAAERFAESEAAMHEAEGIPVTSVRLRLSMLNTRAYLSYHASDFVTAAHLFGRLRDEHRALRNPSREREAMLALAEVEYNLGHTQRAIDTVTEILRGVEKGRYRVFRGSLLSNLAGYMVSIEDCVGAAAAARDAIEELGAHEPNSASVINAMQHLALTLALGSDTSRAATLAGYVEAASERFGYRRELNELASRDRLVAVLQDKVGSDDLGRMLGEGAAMDSETAIEFALRAE